MVSLSAPARSVVGDKTAKQLDALGVGTVEDLLRHYPRRYYERGELTDLSRLVPGELVTVQATIASVTGRQVKPKLHKLDVVVTDGRSRLTVTFFNQVWRQKLLAAGQEVFFAGKVEVFRGKVTLTNPEVAVGEDAEDFAGGLIPVYPATAKLPSWRLRKAVAVALDVVLPDRGSLPDPVPAEARLRRGLLSLEDALRLVHRPDTRDDVRRAVRRLRYDEAFVLQTVLALRRAEAAALPATPRRTSGGGLLEAFDERLPFTLTAGQQEVAAAVAADLAQEHPMHRLLQGEVGSGKTVVALRAMLAVVDAGGQAALLAPTEVLAQQHHRSISAMLGPLAERGLLGGSDIGTRVALLTGSQATQARRTALLDVVSGDAGIVVGTHALIQDAVEFHDLGLVVVDEQHRFGVEQRDALRSKAKVSPHVLVMTATPIPRTVAMTVFGDLDVSTLTELPAGRSPIATHVVPTGEKPHFLDRAWERVREEVAAGHQVYVVCPRIGGSIGGTDDGRSAGPDDGDPDDVPVDVPAADGSDGAAEKPARPGVAVLDVAPMLTEGPLAGLRVEVMHGRLPSDAKDEVMRRFAAGEVDVLVSTTVVEVGVDVANATGMVVLDADRFGVSQLHQLRGRVGRGAAPGLCLLVTDSETGSPARERLDAVAATLDGFELSRLDLEARREGDVLGASQSGRRSSLRLLRVLRDEDLIVDARDDAAEVVVADPDLRAHAGLRDAVDRALAEQRAEYLDKA
ncbi:MAG TPA: ATP-dependent DNA helicase RecG [Actinomycetes bacterium]|nr:ATP-dependent DNA helicase RecG [Actinomycetes bacterium]